MRHHLRLILLAFVMSTPHVVAADTSAIRIGYAPSSTVGLVHIDLFLGLGACGSDAGCSLLDGSAGNVSAPGDDAAAVMAAVDAAMAVANCQGTAPVFQDPVTVPGSTPGEIRHEYRMAQDFASSGVLLSGINFDRGAMSLSLVSPCGPDQPNAVGPYYVSFSGAPAATGNFRLLCHAKPEVDVAIGPAQSTQSIADAVLAAAQGAGIDAFPFVTAGVGFNSHPFQEDVLGVDYAGMSDGSPIPLRIGNELVFWVPTKSETWGSVKARYR